jgi:subtilisin family serine protease
MENGKLSGFSNYGKETVDVAAPGTDILSSVSYYSYNPTIYTEGKQEEISAKFNDFENDSGWGNVSDLKANLYLNGELYDPDSYTGSQSISITRSTAGAFNVKGEDGACGILLEAKNLKKYDAVVSSLPYTISEDASEAPDFSMMVSGDASQEGEEGVFVFLEAPKGIDLSWDVLENEFFGGGTSVVYNGFDYGWVHVSCQTMQKDGLEGAKEQNELERQIVLVLLAYEDGDYKVALDDMGLSKEDLDPEAFEKYDFMRGTSMAAPFVAGAVALYAEQIGYPVGSDTEALISDIISMAKDSYPDSEPLPIIMKGSFDFTKKAAEPGPRIRDIVVDITADTITINGTGLDPEGSGLTVEIGLTGGEKKTATVISQDGNQIAVQDEGWINNVVDTCITAGGGINAVRNEL